MIKTFVLVKIVVFLLLSKSKLPNLQTETNINTCSQDGVSLTYSKLLVTKMAISNKEKQKRYRETRRQAGDSRVACWLAKDDSQRLHKIINIMKENGNTKAGYSDVISEALKELEISLTPAPHKNLVRYGLRFMK